MIPRPEEVTVFENYLIELIEDMTIKSGEVSNLIMGYNFLMYNPKTPDNLIVQKTNSVSVKSSTIIPIVVELSNTNKTELVILDKRLNEAEANTNPDNLVENVNELQSQVESISNNIYNSIEQLANTSSKLSRYLTSAKSEPIQKVVMSSTYNDSEAFVSIRNYLVSGSFSNLRDGVIAQLNNFESVIDSSLNQYNDIKNSLGAIYAEPLEKTPP